MKSKSLEELQREMETLAQKKRAQSVVIDIAKGFNEERNPRYYGKTNGGFNAEEMQVIRSFGNYNLFKDLAGEVSVADLIRVEDRRKTDLGLEKRLELLEVLKNIDLNKRFADQEKIIQDRIEALSTLTQQNLENINNQPLVEALSSAKLKYDMEAVKRCFHKSSKFEKLDENVKQEIGQYYNANTEKVGILLTALGNGKIDSLISKEFLINTIKATKEVARVGQYLEPEELNKAIDESVKKGIFSRKFDIDKFMDVIGKTVSNKIMQEYYNKDKNIKGSSNTVSSSSAPNSNQNTVVNEEVVLTPPPLLSAKSLKLEVRDKSASSNTPSSRNDRTTRSPTFSEEGQSRRESTSRVLSSKSRRNSFAESTSKEKSDMTR